VTMRKKVTVEMRAVGSGTTEFRGSAMIRVGCNQLNVPVMRSRTGGWWQCPAKYGEDVSAWLENRGIDVRIVL
jgi:hypothetical protein